MADLSIFKLDSETITIKDTTARQAADSAKTLATTASGNATTALNKINELESEISALNNNLSGRMYFDHNKISSCGIDIPSVADRVMQLNLWMPEHNEIQLIFTTTGLNLIQYDPSTQKWKTIWSK